MVKVAIQNPFWSQPVAETELSRRIHRAATNLGWAAVEVHTANDIRDISPDFVIALHNNSPKLAEFPTYGCMWNPPSFFEGTEPFVKHVLTYDGYLVSSPVVERWLHQLLVNTPKHWLTAPFYTSCFATPYRPPALDHPQLAYLGSNWDEPRFRSLFEQLDTQPWMQVYGHPTGWYYLQSAYRGTLPFDGASVLETLHRAGMGLCLHREEHCRTALPSMRIFEIVASGAIAICGDHPFIRDAFGDTVLYIDSSLSSAAQGDQIASHVQWVRTHPDAAIALSQSAHRIFSDHYTLEILLQGILSRHLPLMAQKGFRAPLLRPDGEMVNPAPCPSPSPIHFSKGNAAFASPARSSHLQCVVIDQSPDLTLLEDSLKRLSQQTCPIHSIILVTQPSFPQPSDERLQSLLRSLQWSTSIQRLDNSQLIPEVTRSNLLWQALACISSPYFTVLDTTSVLYPNHLATLVSLLENHPDGGLAYSGYLNRDGVGNTSLGINGFQPFHLDAFLTFQLPIAPHGFVARQSLLAAILPQDPHLHTCAELGLLMALKRHTSFLFSYETTCEWQGYPREGDRSPMDQFHDWTSELSRLKFLFWHQEFAPGLSLQSAHTAHAEQRHWQALAEHYRAEWERSQAQLNEAEGTIAAMKTSKFWKLRNLWQRVKGDR